MQSIGMNTNGIKDNEKNIILNSDEIKENGKNLNKAHAEFYLANIERKNDIAANKAAI